MKHKVCSQLSPALKELQKDITVLSSPSGKVYSVNSVLYNSDGERLFPFSGDEAKEKAFLALLDHVATCPFAARHDFPAGDPSALIPSTVLSSYRLRRTPWTHPYSLKPYSGQQVSHLRPFEKRQVRETIKSALVHPTRPNESKTVWNLRARIRAWERMLREDGSDPKTEAELEQFKQALQNLEHKLQTEEDAVTSPEVHEAYQKLHRRKRGY